MNAGTTSDDDLVGAEPDLPLDAVLVEPEATPVRSGRSRPRGFTLLIVALTAVAGALLLAAWHAFDARFGRLLLAAAVFGVVLSAMWWRAWRTGRFDPASPPMLLSLVFFLPSFVVGSVMVAVGWARPTYLAVTTDAGAAVTTAQVLAMAGLAAMWVGFRFAPVARLRQAWRGLGRRARAMGALRSLAGASPARGVQRWFTGASDRAVMFDGCCLLMGALVATVVSFVDDPSDYQSGAAEGTVALLRYAAGLSTPGAFMVWLVRMRRPASVSPRLLRAATALLLAVVLVQAALTGSRGSALTIALALGLAVWFAGVPVRLTRRTLGVAVAGFVVVVGGVLFGSTYRAERQAAGSFADDAAAFEQPGARLAAQQYRGLERDSLESLPPSVSPPFAGTTAGELPDATASLDGGVIDEQLDLTSRSWHTIADRGVGGNVSFVVDRLVERLDQVASFGVVVDRHDELDAREQELGLDSGVPEQLAVAVVPRALWPGKPVVGDIRTLSGLYFEDDSNSYAITAMGDLLRQYGPFGVGAGMLVLGMVLRVLHVVLARPGWAPYRWALFVAILLRATNLEGFYSVIYADMVRVAAVVAVALLGAAAARQLLARLWPVPAPVVAD